VVTGTYASALSRRHRVTKVWLSLPSCVTEQPKQDSKEQLPAAGGPPGYFISAAGAKAGGASPAAGRARHGTASATANAAGGSGSSTRPGAVVHQLNALARTLYEHGGKQRGWRWLDREGPSRSPCAPTADCRLGAYHPTADALSVTALHALWMSALAPS
jgi:hypothetical protein